MCRIGPAPVPFLAAVASAAKSRLDVFSHDHLGHLNNFVTEDGSSLVTNAALREPPSVISVTTLLASANCGRWNSPLRRTTILSCGRAMHPP